MCLLFSDAWCLQMHSYRCISCSFPNNLTNVIIYPKTRFSFGRLGYTLLEFIIVIIIILTHNITSVHSCFVFFHNPHAISMQSHMNNLWHHNISIRLIICMFVLCIAYVWVSLCCSSDLPWRIKIAAPTVLSVRAFRPGIFRSVALFGSLK